MSSGPVQQLVFKRKLKKTNLSKLESVKKRKFRDFLHEFRPETEI